MYITLGQTERLNKYIREFNHEANKLTKGATPILSNLQTVTMFLQALDEGLRRAMVVYLPAIPENARLEDPHPLTNMIEAAKSACNNHVATLISLGVPIQKEHVPANMATNAAAVGRGKTVIPKVETVKKEEAPDELWQRVSSTNDSNAGKMNDLLRTVSQNSALLANIGKLLERTASNTNMGQNYGGYNRNYSNTSLSQNWNNSTEKRICFFCRNPDHIATQCPLQQEYIDKKFIMKNDKGYMIYRDGTPLKYKDTDSESRAQQVLRVAREKGWELKQSLFNSLEEMERAYNDPGESSVYSSFSGEIKAVLENLEKKNKELTERQESNDNQWQEELANINKTLAALLSGN